MSNDCRQLACGERCQIKALMSTGKLLSEIAKRLNPSLGTISREAARNRGKHGYRHQQAVNRHVPRSGGFGRFLQE